MFTQDRIQAMLHYDRDTGEFTWLHRPELPKWINARVVGKRAGYIGKDGYRTIRIDRVNYSAHRLAWLYVHGEWPTSEIDHIDRDRSNNSLSNLRMTSHSANCVNKRVISASGYKGVTWHRGVGKWQAQIERGGKSHYLGVFDDKLEAARAYRAAAISIHGKWSAEMPELSCLAEVAKP